jgi:hypothetical protein
MTSQELQYWVRLRALLIEQEKGITMQRASIIAQRKAIESLLGTEHETHEPLGSETITERFPYTP